MPKPNEMPMSITRADSIPSNLSADCTDEYSLMASRIPREIIDTPTSSPKCQALYRLFPIANLPELPDFSHGTQDITVVRNATSTLVAGPYRDIVLESESRLVLTGGVYNLRTLELKDGATLIFDAAATLNIQFKLRGRDRVAVLPGANDPEAADLQVNYLGIRSKNDRGGEEDDQEIRGFFDKKDENDFKNGKIGRPVIFGNRAFLNFKLLAPKADIHIGKEAAIRKQMAGRRIRIGEGALLSRQDVFAKESDEERVIAAEGARFIGNELVVLLEEGATQVDMQEIARLVDGAITGFVPTPPLIKIEVAVATPQELLDKLQAINDADHPLVAEAMQNFVSQ